MDNKQPVTIKTYIPLLSIIALVLIAALLTNSYTSSNSSTTRFMEFFMGYFFLFFGALKVVTLPTFARSFAMYDPLAAKIKQWGYIYPFFELGLAYAFISHQFVTQASVATIILLGITTMGIYQKLNKGEDLHCACIGMLFKLPLTKVTLIENSVMMIMAIAMLI